MTDIPARQIPPPGVLFLDHIAHFVPDIAAAAATLETLGFALTPWSEQSNRDAEGRSVPAGSANRCVMLDAGYLEFLTPTADTPIAAQIRAAIARHTGLHLIAFGTPDAAGDHARLARNGFEPLPPVNLQREVELEGGEMRTARFCVARVPPQAMPEGRIQFVQQITPECLWQPRYLAHTNGVTGLHAAFVVADDPEAVAARYARYTGMLPRAVRGFVQLRSARGAVYVGSDTACKSLFGCDAPAAPGLAGYGLACDRPELLLARLRALGCVTGEPSPGLYSAQLPQAIGSAWVFGTPAAYADWLSPGCG